MADVLDSNTVVLYAAALSPILLPTAFGVYWFVTTYATQKWVGEQVEELRKEISALEAELEKVGKDLADGRVLFATVQTELGYIKSNLVGLNNRLDKLLEGRIREPQCTVATDAPGARPPGIYKLSDSQIRRLNKETKNHE